MEERKALPVIQPLLYKLTIKLW